MLTQDRLKFLLSYDAETGVFARIAPTKGARIGAVQPSIGANGYQWISVDNRKYPAHRLAWLYVYGSWPRHRLCHLNGVATDNRIDNLREERGSNLDAKRLRQLLNYNPSTGEFARNLARGRGKVGDIVAGVNLNGYLSISVDGKRYMAHRLAWLFMHGRWPSSEIDHANGSRSDNRMENLREATPTQNQGNKKKNKNNTSGFKGVHFHRQSGKWRATIFVDYKPVCLGLWNAKEDAAEAYRKAAVEVFGAFARGE